MLYVGDYELFHLLSASTRAALPSVFFLSFPHGHSMPTMLFYLDFLELSYNLHTGTFYLVCTSYNASDFGGTAC